MSNLLSGLFGALIGGLAAIVAAGMTSRHDRSQARRNDSRRAAYSIKENILKIKDAIYRFPAGSESENDTLLETVRTLAESIRYVLIGQIDNRELRSRIDELISVVIVWYDNAESVSAERMKVTSRYMSYVDGSIQDYLDEKQLSQYQSPPNLLAVENPQSKSSSAGLSDEAPKT
jgi:gas vesicle protein